MSETTIGSLLDDWLSNIDILFDYCDKLAIRINKLEDELKALRAETSSLHAVVRQIGQNNAVNDVYAIVNKPINTTGQSEYSEVVKTTLSTKNDTVNPISQTTQQFESAQQVESVQQILYAVPREQNGKIILNIMAAERKQVAPFLLRVMQNEAEVEYNKDFVWSVDMLETKLFAYVDYVIKNKDITCVTQLSAGYAVLDNNRWIIKDKLVVQI